MSALNEAALAYVRFVCDQLELSPTALAKEVGISSTTLTRPLNDAHHKHALSMTTIDKISKHTGFSFAPFADSKSIPQFASNLVDPSNYDKDLLEHGPLPEADSVPIIGDAAADVWRGFDGVDAMRRGSITLKPTRYDIKDCFAVRMADDSMANIASKFDIIICVRPELWRGSFRGNEIFVVERKSSDSKLTELSARRMRVKESGAEWEFYFDSPNDKWNETVPFLGNHKDPNVRIVGCAIFIVRSVWGTWNDA